jgi:hypothetical protein
MPQNVPPAYVHKQRHYLHFDPPVSEATARALATSPERVARHPFYPLIGFTLTTPKVQVDEEGRFNRKPKKRPIKLAAHADAAIYGYYGQILSSGYEQALRDRSLEHTVIAFRRAGAPGRNNISFAREAFDFIEQHRPCVAIGLDIEKFFDRLSHSILKQRWQATLGATRLPADHFNVFRSLTDFAWVDRNRAYRACGVSPHNPKPKDQWRTRICSPGMFRERIRDGGLIWGNPDRNQGRGIPQGAPISALLSNVYMLDFDTVMQAAVSAEGGLYRRYCDDIIIVVPPHAKDAIEQLAGAQIAAVGLAINPGKTTRAEFPAGAAAAALDGERTQFLGFDFDGVRRMIRASSLTRYYGKMRRGVNLARQTWRKHNRREDEAGVLRSDLKTRQLFIRYSYLINRRFRSLPDGHERQGENFITYAYRAASEMNAPEIKRQVRNHLTKLKAAIRQARK